ncbi:MAG: NUDIX domain-containing protein [Candidatus Moraniibacteriota bacterium]|nr:MAG: NUDIX domain-containing protein [Candidatus Moranbacteria bacterium]
MKKSLDVRKGIDFIGVTCVFVCHDGKGNILLHRRSGRCRDEQGVWDTGGGSMEFGETFEETVKREIREEYGVTAKHLKQITFLNTLRMHEGIPTHWVKALFTAEVDPRKVKIGEPDKMDEIGWFPVGKFPKPMHSETVRNFRMIKRAGVKI